ncbi:MAG: hypothetical protein WBA74_00830 [Cyclobacteriaceae bacterium]
MRKKKKLKKRLEELEEKLSTYTDQRTANATNQKRNEKYNIGFLILGTIIGCAQLIIAYQQNSIVQHQNKIAENQFDVARRQVELEEFEIYNKLIDLDENNVKEVDHFFQYIDLLEAETATKLIQKTKELEASYLSFKALNIDFEKKL